MPPKRLPNDIVRIQNAFRKYKDEITDKTGKLLNKKNAIWETVSKDLDGMMSPLALYTAAAKGYYDSGNILERRVAKESRDHHCNNLCCNHTDSDNSDSYYEVIPIVKNKKDDGSRSFSFQITITFDEFMQLFPHHKEYARNNDEGIRQGLKRDYYIFETFSWTHQIYEKIKEDLRSHRCECAFMFKRSKIFPCSEKIYANFSAYCKDCGATLVGNLLEPPLGNEARKIFFTVNNLKEIPHDSKRPLSGAKRQNLATQLLQSNMAPSQYRRMSASKEMAFGDNEPVDLPRLKTLRVAKHQMSKRKRLDDDPVRAICKAKYNPNFKGAIRDIGVSPFFVLYWTNTQIHVYNKYCERNYAKVCIDATGGVVRKIKNVSGEKSSHIFLYEITIHDVISQSENQYSVGNMLSETQSTIAINTWLQKWLKSGARIPNEVVTDQSVALLNACIRAFTTRCKSILEYTSHFYDVIFNSKSLDENCYIRCDVAHVIKKITEWPSMRNQHHLTKQFYMRCMGQVIQCTDIEDLESMLFALFTVAYSDTEGNNELDEATSCEIRKNWLKRRISTGTKEIEIAIMISEVHCASSDEDKLDDESPTDSKEYGTDKLIGIHPFQVWVENIATTCKSVVNIDHEIGDRGNQQCLPNFVEDFKKSSKTIALWTSIMKNHFTKSPLIASSATVESNFNNLKNRTFKNVTLPVRVDEFLKVHIDSNDGIMKLSQSAVNQRENIPFICNSNEADQADAAQSSDFLEDEAESERINSSKIDETVISSKNDRYIGNIHQVTTSQEITCPSCQLMLTSNMSCRVCMKPIHGNTYCSERDAEGRILCLACTKKSPRERIESEEMSSFENWRSLGHPEVVKKRPRLSYLEPNSELLTANFESLRRVKPIALLRNGHLEDLQPIKIANGVFITLSNTCAFDSLLQILSCCYCDSECFQQLIDQNENNLVFAIVKDLASNGISRKTYKLRAHYLFAKFESTQHPQGIVKLDVSCTMNQMINVVMDELKSALRSKFCALCTKVYEENFLHAVNLTISEGFKRFQEDVSEAISNKKRKAKCKTKICSKAFIEEKTELSPTHLLIEPFDPKNCPTMALKAPLKDAPHQLFIRGSNYTLRGVIGYTGPTDSVGHFTAYCYRHNNCWEIYNDLHKKSKPCSATNVVTIETIIYSA